MHTTPATMTPARRGRAAAVAAATAALVALTGCGDSATTTDEATATSIAPLPRESLSATATTPAGGDTDESVPAAAKVKKPADYGIEDQGAKEITAIPTFESSHTDSDRTYLKALTGAGITVDDIEDQLIGAGVEVCRTRAAGELDVTLPAVAGQLVEQQRTRLGAEETANAIASAAQAAYCRTP